MPFTTLFIDLDDTLYPNTSGLWNEIRSRMMVYMRERMGFQPDEIYHLRQTYFEAFGTTLRGLQINHHVDADEYLSYVHDLPLHNFLKPDPELRALLLSLPQRKWIFTNADANHAARVLSILGLSNCFAGIIDIHALDFHCKPEPVAYQRAFLIARESIPHNCVMLDDSTRNLAPARQMGVTTVLVGSVGSNPAVDYSIPNLNELSAILPELWTPRKSPWSSA